MYLALIYPQIPVKTLQLFFGVHFKLVGVNLTSFFHAQQNETDPEKAGDAAISRQEDIKRIPENKLLERRIRHGNGEVRTKQSHPDAY